MGPACMLLHPVTLVALAVLIVNDGWLRGAHPCWLTGKLSDAAAVVFFPATLATLYLLVTSGLDRVARLLGSDRGVPHGLSLPVILGATLVTGGILVGINVQVAFRDCYLRALEALDPFGLFGPFHYTMDPGDLLALVFLPVPVWVGLACRRTMDVAP